MQSDVIIIVQIYLAYVLFLFMHNDINHLSLRKFVTAAAQMNQSLQKSPLKNYFGSILYTFGSSLTPDIL